jgi:hypothetical protein
MSPIPTRAHPPRSLKVDSYFAPPILNQTHPPSMVLPPGILAFRTITYLLSCLQKPGAMKLSDKASLDDEVRRELRLLDALATLFVRRHEIVAVVRVRSAQPEQGEYLQIVCAHSINDNYNTPPTGNTQSTSGFWELRTTANYRRDKNDPSSGCLGLGEKKQDALVILDDLRDHVNLNAYVQFKNFKLLVEPFS